jgi:NADH dehydrogenase/NADH:ubiquinone oxidoreductase subunit G
MADITIRINGKEMIGAAGSTILDVAAQNGIDIPTLCYLKDLLPTGSCRACVVEVEGSRTLVASCLTPITPGMVVQTHSPKVIEARRIIMELLLASHCGTCYMCEKANICELREIAVDLDVGVPRFPLRRRFYPIEDESPYIQRDLSKCILCRKCIRACNEIARKHVYAMGYRGFDSKVIVDFDEMLNKEVCKNCGICIPHCPTGALKDPQKTRQEKKGPPLVIKG